MNKLTKEQVTNNIYTSWIETASSGFYMRFSGYMTKPLHEFNLKELAHLKWLIEQEMESRDAETNT